ncbi:alpha/beta hydrolase fold domain-containing protein [Algiphilus sp.]|uniref:alpha/beta hydrolase fold domain-containing protein n=1 Tax=Algiphilus sp. TaxID=1872431 RepID=UPI0025C05C2D|nr:alpha/beta hydrolase fold domain-containing protein [Algiphilus sp.]MCK5769234.1 alpha/beta hydrolase fold domain-containing protein [Algiphilus sp.]
MEPATASQPDTASGDHLVRKAVVVGLRTRFVMRCMRFLLRPWLSFVLGGPHKRIARIQLRLAAQACRDSAGLAVVYRVLGKCPGHAVGDIDATDAPVVLYLHGGGFVLPAVPATHVSLLARICRDLGASGFMADYRLAPFNHFPAALDDCEQAYRALLDRGFPAHRIVMAGESAGGNLLLGLLQRIRRAGLPMPAGAVPISPVTEMGRIHAPPARARLRNRDPILPAEGLHRIDPIYSGGHDAADPELSPLYMDCHDLPPIRFLVSDGEILLDDTLLLAERMRDAGTDVRVDVWPKLPHGFPLFGAVMPEVVEARHDMTAFMRHCLENRAG